MSDRHVKVYRDCSYSTINDQRHHIALGPAVRDSGSLVVDPLAGRSVDHYTSSDRSRSRTYGFVFHFTFGKAYSLIPTYFNRTLAQPRAAAVQFPLTTTGVACLAAEPFPTIPGRIGLLGAICWSAGVAIFVGVLVWTIRDNFTGTETGTGGVNAHRTSIDRVSNVFVPVVLAYLLLGSYETVAMYEIIPSLFDGYPPQATHLLGAGAATLLVFALGFRLLPRFLAVKSSAILVYVVLPTGALAPIMLAASLPTGRLLVLAGILEALAVIGYGIEYCALFRRSNRRRVAFYGVLAGIVAVLVGLLFAMGGITFELLALHRRLILLGFLGLTIVGVSFQFYPPNVGRWPACTDRTAFTVIGLFVAAVIAHIIALGISSSVLERVGAVLGLSGALGYGYLLGGAFATRR